MAAQRHGGLGPARACTFGRIDPLEPHRDAIDDNSIAVDHIGEPVKCAGGARHCGADKKAEGDAVSNHDSSGLAWPLESLDEPMKATVRIEWSDLAQNFEALAGSIGAGHRHAGEIPSGARQALH